MLCRVEMPTNEQTYGRFYRYQMLRGSAWGNIILLPIILIGAGLLLWFSGSNSLLALAPVALALVYLWYSLWLKPGMTFRKKGGIAMQTEIYIFTEAGYTRSVRSEEGGLPDNTSGRYDGLHSAVETGKDFYLYTSPKQAYLVDKEYFTKGGPEELRESLQKALGSRFKGKK